MDNGRGNWRHDEFPVPSGAYVHVARRPGAGEALLLLHGPLASWQLWLPFLEGEPDPVRGRPVVALDLRGHGRSAKPDAGYTVDHFAADAIAALDAAQVWPVTIIGERLGALVALEIARLRPGDTRPLILVEPPLPGPWQGVETDEFWENETDLLAWLAELKRQLETVMQESLAGIFPELPSPVIERKAADLRLVADGYFDALLAGEAVWDGFIERFEPDHRPVMVLRGSQRGRSGVAETGISQLQETYPALVITEIEGGHDLLAENPAGVAEVVRRFLAL